ncbi:type VI secretion system baseplate subunit TssK [Archangium sp.]|jgi:type VI secretion system protein ImpJ|uniref:type VI secretion system baseplate subunit TssK n=1 Tax=Archangium sp. TaxID=1872627 RepID=UPI002EDA937C
MPIPAAVQWTEGMLLAPQHFQQQALRHEELLHHHLRQLAPFHWGVSHLAYDELLLKQGVLRVQELDAVMPDGLVVEYRYTEEDRLELVLSEDDKQLLAKGPHRLHLAVFGNKRSGAGPDSGRYRYASFVSEALLDEHTRDLPLRIAQQRPWLRLSLGEPRPDDCSLPLLELKSLGTSFAAVSEFIEPRLTVPESSTLGRVCVRVARRILQKALYLRSSLQGPTASADSGLREHHRRLIHYLVAGLPAFEALRRTGVAHPFALYTALCTLAGQVAAVGSDPVPPGFISGYRHDRLRESFDEIVNFIFRCLEEGIPEHFHRIPLREKGDGFSLLFAQEWAGRKLVLGVEGAPGASPGDTKGWVEGCRIATARQMPELRNNRTLGVGRRHVDHREGLIHQGNLLLFELDHLATRALRPGELLELENTHNGKRQEPHPAQAVLYVSKD